MTRHPCPFCDWALEAPPLPETRGWTDTWAVMTALSNRLERIKLTMQTHISAEHPDEFEAAEVDIAS